MLSISHTQSLAKEIGANRPLQPTASHKGTQRLTHKVKSQDQVWIIICGLPVHKERISMLGDAGWGERFVIR